MSGFLDSNYGVDDARRERRTKTIVLGILLSLLAAVVLYFSVRNRGEEQALHKFLQQLNSKDYQGAYTTWGCTQDTPCKGYSPERFNEDWGPSGMYKNIAEAKIQNEDVCGNQVVFTIAIPNTEPFGLMVDSGSKTIGFAPWVRCPGRHWQVWEFLKSRFS